MKMLHTTIRAAAIALSACLFASAAAADGKLAIKAGRVLPGPGMPELEKATIVIDNGRIAAIGKD
ncbi:MAG: hypothetical protein ACKO4Q_08030, partial [Planctomycetota bacterium]